MKIPVAMRSRQYDSLPGLAMNQVAWLKLYNVLIVDDVEDLYVKYDSSSIRPAVGTDGLRPSLTQISLMHKELAG